MSKNLSLEEFKILERRIHDEYPDITKDEFNRKIVEFMIMTIELEPEPEPEIEEGYTSDKDYPDQ